MPEDILFGSLEKVREVNSLGFMRVERQTRNRSFNSATNSLQMQHKIQRTNFVGERELWG